MEFFGRAGEIAELRRIREVAKRSARMTVLTGRRRVGKTALAREALDDGRVPYVHLPVTRQSEATLCAQLQEECASALGIEIHGKCRRFGELFGVLMRESLKRHFTLVIDEFQELDRMNPGVFGDIQAEWDRHHEKSKMNLLISGSVNRLMNKIFFADSEPLYGRNTGRMRLEPFGPGVIKEILGKYNPRHTKRDLLAFWTITGGVARYADLLVGEDALTRERMLEAFFSGTSSFLDEGRTILADEFGPDYGTYFSILGAISSGQTKSAEIKNLLGTEVGGFLSKLEHQYGVVAKQQPIFAKETSKNCHFRIEDNFLRFWFRFVFKNRHLQELGRYGRMRELAERDFDVFAGYALERYFRAKFIEETDCTRIGGWWDRRGENEIDMICCGGEREEALEFYEIKTDPGRIDLQRLAVKAEAFWAKHPERRGGGGRIAGLSVEDM